MAPLRVCVFGIRTTCNFVIWPSPYFGEWSVLHTFKVIWTTFWNIDHFFKTCDMTSINLRKWSISWKMCVIHGPISQIWTGVCVYFPDKNMQIRLHQSSSSSTSSTSPLLIPHPSSLDPLTQPCLYWVYNTMPEVLGDLHLILLIPSKPTSHAEQGWS